MGETCKLDNEEPFAVGQADIDRVGHVFAHSDEPIENY